MGVAIRDLFCLGFEWRIDLLDMDVSLVESVFGSAPQALQRERSILGWHGYKLLVSVMTGRTGMIAGVILELQCQRIIEDQIKNPDRCGKRDDAPNDRNEQAVGVMMYDPSNDDSQSHEDRQWHDAESSLVMVPSILHFLAER